MPNFNAIGSAVTEKRHAEHLWHPLRQHAPRATAGTVTIRHWSHTRQEGWGYPPKKTACQSEKEPPGSARVKIGGDGLVPWPKMKVQNPQGPTKSRIFRVQDPKVPRQVSISGSRVPKVPWQVQGVPKLMRGWCRPLYSRSRTLSECNCIGLGTRGTSWPVVWSRDPGGWPDLCR